MTRLTTITALLISFAAFGQDSLNTKVNSESKRLQFGLSISPDYCYRTLKNNDGSTNASAIIDIRDANETYKIGYSAGVNMCYTISKKLAIELGVQYSKKGYAQKKTELTFGDLIDPRYGTVYTSSSSAVPANFKLRYNHIYLDVPLRAIFCFGEKKIHFLASVGLAANFLLKATQTLILQDENGDTKRETSNQPYDFNTFNISPTFSIGVDYIISRKINLQVEPTFRYGLLKFIDAPVTGYLWNAGLNFTCYYTLK